MRPAHTRYRKSVLVAPPSPVKSTGLRVLKSAATNDKLGDGGRVVTKGRYRGLPLYALTLEERATCWSGCQNWECCYGDNMPFGKRYAPGAELLDALAYDLVHLGQRDPDGFVVRLHVLGDFYDVSYVAAWANWMDQHQMLHLFGYTHWPYDHPIGQAVAALARAYPDRAAFRRSDGMDPADPLLPAHTVPMDHPAVAGTVFCPEQTGKTVSCTTCGLCMDHRVGITFIDHSRSGKRQLPVAA